MQTENTRKAALIEAIMLKNKAMIQALIAEKKPAKLVILNPGDPDPVEVPGDETMYVLYVPSLQCKEPATSEAEVDLEPLTPCHNKPCYHSCVVQFPDEEYPSYMKYRMGLTRRPTVNPGMN